MNILVLTSFATFGSEFGGSQNYTKEIYTKFSNYSFIEFPIWWSEKSRNIKSSLPNVIIDDSLSKWDNFIFEKFEKYKFFLKIKFFRISNFFEYLNAKINRKEIASKLEEIINDKKIEFIILNTNLFFDKNFFEKYVSKIIFVQHMHPLKYNVKYNFSSEKRSFLKNNFFLTKINVFATKKLPIIENIKKCVVFNKDNEHCFMSMNNKCSYENILPPIEIYNPNKIHKKIYDFIFTGRLVLEKGISEIIQFANLNNNKILIVGSDKKNDVNLNDNITYEKWLDKEKLYKCYGESKFYLSFSYHEGMPLSVIEAMSQGLPCIVANTFPSAKFLIGNNERGFLFDLNDTNYNEKILNYINNIEYRDIQKKCIDFIESNFKNDNFKIKWNKLLNSSN